MLISSQWLGMVETATFIILLGTLIYNRAVNWKRMNERMLIVETAFKQYQVDIKHYLDICEVCRTEVRKHHEGVTAEHVTPLLREQIANLVRDIAEIKSILMDHARS